MRIVLPIVVLTVFAGCESRRFGDEPVGWGGAAPPDRVWPACDQARPPYLEQMEGDVYELDGLWFRARLCGDVAIANVDAFKITDEGIWHEVHPLETVSIFRGNSTAPPGTGMRSRLDHVPDDEEIVEGETTHFNADDRGTMTYAMRVYSEPGFLTDCAVWGLDRSWVMDGEFVDEDVDVAYPEELDRIFCLDWGLGGE